MPVIDASAAAPARSTTITIENRRNTPIWVQAQTSCAQLPFAVTSPEGDVLRLDGQVLGCEAARAGTCPTFGSCRSPGVTRVEPGAKISADWHGLMMVTRTLSAAEAKPGCPTTCADWNPARPGTYVVTAAAWSRCTDAGCTGEPDLAADVGVIIHESGPSSPGVLMVFTSSG